MSFKREVSVKYEPSGENFFLYSDAELSTKRLLHFHERLRGTFQTIDELNAAFDKVLKPFLEIERLTSFPEMSSYFLSAMERMLTILLNIEEVLHDCSAPENGQGDASVQKLAKCLKNCVTRYLVLKKLVLAKYSHKSHLFPQPSSIEQKVYAVEVVEKLSQEVNPFTLYKEILIEENAAKTSEESKKKHLKSSSAVDQTNEVPVYNIFGLPEIQRKYKPR